MNTFWLCVIVASLALLVGAALGYWTAATDLEAEKAAAHREGVKTGFTDGVAWAREFDDEGVTEIRPDDEQAPR